MKRGKKLVNHLRSPTPSDLMACAAEDHMRLTPDEAAAFLPLVVDLIEMIDGLEELPILTPTLKHVYRDPGRSPRDGEDPFNAFTRFCRVKGAPDGLLSGKRVGIKDNLALAGIPTTNGARTAAYTPQTDAVVVERILDAGGTIVGKLNLDSYSAGAFGESSFFGPPRNPRKPMHSPGGSSGGAGAAVVSGSVDMALGVDEGGSARIPAAFCGCVAIKATHGLVPSFGLSYFDHTLDYICPMASTVADVALMLQVIAGHDWRDPQWVRGELRVDDYLAAGDAGVDGLRVGVIAESLDPAMCDAAVLDGVRRACDLLESAGADVHRVSIPLFRSTSAIFMGTLFGGSPSMIRSDGHGYNHLGYADVAQIHHNWITRRQEADDYSTFIKLILLGSSYLASQYGQAVFARVHNQRLALQQAIDDAFGTCDVLITPTSPVTAPKLTEEKMSLEEQIARLPDAGVFFPFTQAFNLSCHPALVLPSGLDADGLPTSVQIAARRFREYDAFRVGYVLEETFKTLLQTPASQTPLPSFVWDTNSDATPLPG